MSISEAEPAQHIERPRVGLFVTCLVDLFRPSVGFAAVKLLEDAGCSVEVPAAQTCCGQPAYNSGARGEAIEMARQTIAAFEGFDYVVVPSGSCGGMIKRHYPELLEADAVWAARAKAVAAKTYELVSFLVDVRGVSQGRRRLDRPRPPITMPARVCASSVSASSRASCSDPSPAWRSSRSPTATPAAASAARSRSSIPTSPTPSSRTRRSASPPPAATCSSPAISAAS